MRARRAARGDPPRPGVRDRVGVRGLRRRRPCSRRRHGRPDSRASSVGAPAGQRRRHPRQGRLRRDPPGADRAGSRGQLPGWGLADSRAAPRVARGCRRGWTGARRQHRLDRRRHRVHPCGSLLGLEARPGGVLPVAAGRVARERDRGAHGPAGVRHDTRLPTSQGLRNAARPPRSSSAPSASRGTSSRRWSAARQKS